MTPTEAVITEDGSLTCRDSETGELYHNRAGAYLEALRNYVQPSSAYEYGCDIVVLDQCFGLGYNSLVLIDQLSRNRTSDSNVLRLKIDAIEIDAEILSLVPRVLQQPCFAHLTSSFHIAPDSLSTFGEHTLCGRTHRDDLIEIRIKQVDLRKQMREYIDDNVIDRYDLIYHDPFSPSKCPEFWTVDIFRVYKRILKNPSGRILTYSAASAVRGGLIEAGFDVWRTESVGGKSGGTLAMHTNSRQKMEPFLGLPLHFEESRKLRSASGVPYRDPSLSESRSDVLAGRRVEQLDCAG